jgi:hypothetical protein
MRCQGCGALALPLTAHRALYAVWWGSLQSFPWLATSVQIWEVTSGKGMEHLVY